MCTFGGGPELDRGPERILPGASRIEITITASPTHTGIQIGWSIDDGDVRWTPTVARGTETHDAPVRPEDTETDAHRWRFFHQMNVKEAEQDCYTGGGAGESRILLEAVRG